MAAVEPKPAVPCSEQMKVMLAQNAASLGRLAAALSHELNSPLGALLSSVDSLEKFRRRANSGSSLEENLLDTIRTSALRLRDAVQRMQRFTNLDRAEIRLADINTLLTDAVALTDPAVFVGVRIETELTDCPEIVCHPLQLSAVFETLLRQAIASAKPEGRVLLRSYPNDHRAYVEIHDSGPGIAADELQNIFEPSFHVQAGRVTATNWDMFSCRQIVQAHDGDIAMASAEGEGTSVRIYLPFAPVQS
jgi:signal transduction histidine kinase